MANSTLRGALSIHGQNPQFLVEKVIRARIYDTLFWKEQCFALTAESIIDKALELNAIGGVHDRQIPTPFICLTLKLLQLQPEKEILIEYLLAEEFKYLRALAALYIRLTFRSFDVYEILEPLMKDFRKLRVRQPGGYVLTYFDEFVDDLLTKERVCDIILPRLTQRAVLEETEGLPPRQSLLEEDEERGARGSVKEDEGQVSDIEAGPSRRSRRLSGTPSRTPESRDSSPDLRRNGTGDAARKGRRRSSSADALNSDGRYISRSPSRSISPDRLAASKRAGNGMDVDSEDEEDGEEGDVRDRYVSRSPSRGSSFGTPERQTRVLQEAEAAERIDGDI